MGFPKRKEEGNGAGCYGTRGYQKEANINAKFQEKVKGLEDWEILQKNFDRMK